MKVGDRTKIAVYVDGSAPFRSAVIGLKFDETKIAVRGVTFGEMFGKAANSTATPLPCVAR